MASEVHPVDAGVIRCICGFEHDDKFTIQCEKCNAWQHAICVDIFDEDAVPDVYLCDLCGGHKHDTNAAIERQLRSLRKRRKGRRSPELEPPLEAKKRGRKKRQPAQEENETVVDSPSTYYVTAHENVYANGVPGIVDSALAAGSEIPVSTKEQLAKAAKMPLAVDRVHEGYGISAYSLSAVNTIPSGRLVLELRGELVTSEMYRQNPINQYRAWGCTKPGAFQIPNLPLVLDARRVGTNGAFLRRSRKPNMRLAPCLVDGKLRVAVYSTRSIKPGTELTIPWDWDASHPMSKLFGLTLPADVNDAIELAELDPTEAACVSSSLHMLQHAGLVRTLQDCIPAEPSSTLSRASPVLDSTQPSVMQNDAWALLKAQQIQLQQEFMSRTPETEPARPDKRPLRDTIAEVLIENVWVPANLVSAEPTAPEPQKKKLSLADYKRKRPYQPAFA